MSALRLPSIPFPPSLDIVVFVLFLLNNNILKNYNFM